MSVTDFCYLAAIQLFRVFRGTNQRQCEQPPFPTLSALHWYMVLRSVGDHLWTSISQGTLYGGGLTAVFEAHQTTTGTSRTSTVWVVLAHMLNYPRVRITNLFLICIIKLVDILCYFGVFAYYPSARDWKYRHIYLFSGNHQLLAHWQLSRFGCLAEASAKYANICMQSETTTYRILSMGRLHHTPGSHPEVAIFTNRQKAR
jgi:hypothetical protein